MLWSFAKEDITPHPGLWQDGFPTRTGPATGTLDPLFVRAAALKSGDSAFLFLSVETLVLTDERAAEIRRAVAAATGVFQHRVLAAATHTHGAPMSLPTEHEQDYEGWWKTVVKKSAEAAARAMDTLEPAEFDVAAGYSRIAVNRREMTEMGIDGEETPKAAIDRNLRVLRVMGGDGRLLGAILQGACHPACMREHNDQYTGDWPGRACRELEERHGGAVMLYFNGASGDAGPRREEGESDRECLEKTAGTFAEDVEKLIGKPFSPHMGEGVAAADSETDVPMRKLNREELTKTLEEWRERMAVAPDDSWDKIAGVYCGRFMEEAFQLHDTGRKPVVKATLQAVRIASDVAFLAMPFEAHASTAKSLVHAMKEIEVPKPNVFTVCYANGMNGYLPTAGALRKGGHEAEMSAWFYGLPSYYSPKAEREVRDRLMALWEETRVSE